jgi:hypothetical protein
MNIKTFPADYSGALVPVIYTLDRIGPEEIIEVEILGEDGANVAGVKRLHGETQYTVNVAGYIQSRLAVEPVSSSGYGFVYPYGRTARSQIRAGGVLSNVSIITAGSEKCPVRIKIPGAPGIAVVAPGERDEIAFIAAAGSLTAEATLYGKAGSSTFQLTSTTTPGGLCVLCGKLSNISGAEAIGENDEVEIAVRDSQGVVARQRYRIAAPKKSTVRMCWQNRYGQVDYYSFDLLEKSTTVDKNKVRVESGYETLGVSEEMSYTLVSQCETEKMIEWLSGILSSPRVWMIENDEAKPVDITTGSTVLKGKGPQALTLSVRRTVETSR